MAFFMRRYFYLYKITNIINNHYYYGVRASKKSPELDSYMGSGVYLAKAKKKYGIHNFKKEIIETFKTSEDMYKKEAEIVNENLIKDPNCYNIVLGGIGRIKGFKECYDRFGNWIYASENDPKLKTGELCVLIVVKDKNGKTFKTRKDDPRYLSGELVGVTKGMANMKDEHGNEILINIDSDEYKSGKYVGRTKGKFVVKNNNGDILQIEKGDPRYLSGEVVSLLKNKVVIKDENGENKIVNKEEFINNNLKGVRKNTVIVRNKDNVCMCVNVNDPRYLSGELLHTTKNRVSVINVKTGETLSVYKNDPRYLNGELISIAKNKINLFNDENKRLVIYKHDILKFYNEYQFKYMFHIQINKKQKTFYLKLNDPYIKNNSNIVFCKNKYNQNRIELLKKYNIIYEIDKIKKNV